MIAAIAGDGILRKGGIRPRRLPEPLRGGYDGQSRKERFRAEPAGASRSTYGRGGGEGDAAAISPPIRLAVAELALRAPAAVPRELVEVDL